MDFLNDPATIGAAARPLFWLIVLAGVAVLLKFVPRRVRNILTRRLF